MLPDLRDIVSAVDEADVAFGHQGVDGADQSVHVHGLPVVHSMDREKGTIGNSDTAVAW